MLRLFFFAAFFLLSLVCFSSPTIRRRLCLELKLKKKEIEPRPRRRRNRSNVNGEWRNGKLPSWQLGFPQLGKIEEMVCSSGVVV